MNNKKNKENKVKLKVCKVVDKCYRENESGQGDREHWRRGVGMRRVRVGLAAKVTFESISKRDEQGNHQNILGGAFQAQEKADGSPPV